MKKIIPVIISTLLLTTSCTTSINAIKLNGNVEETIEAGSIYVDKGVTIPSGYTYSTNGYINTSVLGEYEVIYSIYSDNGELVKELHRIIKVVDTTAPTFIETSISTLNINYQYKLSDFISDYSDNLTNKSSIKVETLSTLYFTEKGYNEIVFRFTDGQNNSSAYRKTFYVDFSVEEFIREMKADGKVTTGTSSGTGDYIRIAIDDLRNITYYYNNDQLIYRKKVDSTLGDSASLSFSVANKNYSQGDITLNVSKTGGSYSAGFFSINLNQSRDTLTYTSFRSIINNLNLDTSEMLQLANDNLYNVYKEFIIYCFYDWRQI